MWLAESSKQWRSVGRPQGGCGHGCKILKGSNQAPQQKCQLRDPHPTLVKAAEQPRLMVSGHRWREIGDSSMGPGLALLSVGVRGIYLPRDMPASQVSPGRQAAQHGPAWLQQRQWLAHPRCQQPMLCHWFQGPHTEVCVGFCCC